MTIRRDDPYSIRWRLAATLGPEIVAFALAMLLAVGVVIAVWSGSPSGAENRSPEPSLQPGPTGFGSDSRLVGLTTVVPADRTRSTVASVSWTLLNP